MTHTPLTKEDRALAGKLTAFYKDHLYNLLRALLYTYKELDAIANS